MLRFLSAGESHGPCLLGIVEGLPAGLPLGEDDLLPDLQQRQAGYGRGGRMQIESDRAEILSGVARGRTTGAPLGLRIENKDWPNWQGKDLPPITVPRPGHADLAGWWKYRTEDMRLVAERSSARETAMRVAIGGVAKKLLAELGISVVGHVVQVGSIKVDPPSLVFTDLAARVDGSPLRCADPEAERLMIEEIDKARARGDSLGGVFEVVARGVPPGLGSYVHWDRRLDGRLAQALMSIPAIKGVEVGQGFASAERPGSQVHDELFVEAGRLFRRTNRAGGLEGGVTNGEPIVIRAAMKPIPTLLTPLRSVDVAARQPTTTQYQRSDVCAVPAASVVGAAAVAWVLAEVALEKFGGDTLAEMKAALARYVESLEGLWTAETSS